MAVIAEEEFSFQPIESVIVDRCHQLQKELQQEQTAIKNTEKELSQKIDIKELGKDDLNQLIKAHLTSIDEHNRKIESFNDTCTTISVQKHTIRSPKPQKTKVQTTNKSDHFVSDERWAQVLLSKDKIKAMKGYFLQVGAFKNTRFAKRLIHKLSAKGWNMHAITRAYVDVVWVGSFDSLREANEAKSALKDQHGLDSYLIRLQ